MVHRGKLGTRFFLVEGFFVFAVNDGIVKSIFHKNGFILLAKEFFGIGFVLGKKSVVGFGIVKIIRAQAFVFGFYHMGLIGGFDHRFFIQSARLPAVKEPECRQYRNGCSHIGAVSDLDADADIFLVYFGVSDEYIKIFIILKNACVQNFIFRLQFAALFVFIDQLLVRECLLRILVEHLHIIMRRQVFEIVVEFLYIFAMVALVIAETK